MAAVLGERVSLRNGHERDARRRRAQGHDTSSHPPRSRRRGRYLMHFRCIWSCVNPLASRSAHGSIALLCEQPRGSTQQYIQAVGVRLRVASRYARRGVLFVLYVCLAACRIVTSCKCRRACRAGTAHCCPPDSRCRAALRWSVCAVVEFHSARNDGMLFYDRDGHAELLHPSWASWVCMPASRT